MINNKIEEERVNCQTKENRYMEETNGKHDYVITWNGTS